MSKQNHQTVNSYHKNCRHAGTKCGDKYHGTGHGGYCHYCTKCNSSGCFITTATLLSIGKNDNCNELETFRNFRDNWLVKQPNGKELIFEYYKIAPQIVLAIDSISDSERIYKELWLQSIEPCLKLIGQNCFSEAHIVYFKAVFDLKDKYLNK